MAAARHPATATTRGSDKAGGARAGGRKLFTPEESAPPVHGHEGGGAHPLIQVASFRQAARLAAMQTELRLLGDMASHSAILGLQPYLQINSPRLRRDTVVRGQRDPRFRLPASQLRELLDRFCAELEDPSPTPSAMIVVAHQDDEAIGAGARLCALADAIVVHVTDGAPRDVERVQRMGFDRPEEYAIARREELLSAMGLAGVGPDRLFCLGVPDGEAAHRLVELSHALAEMMSAFAPEVVLTHPYEGGHTDHDAVAFAVHLACGMLRRDGAPAPVTLELTSYHYRNGKRVVGDFLPNPGAAIRTLELGRQARDLKKRMYECFATQRDVLKHFPVDVERFRPAPRYVFTKPPHPGPLDYERHRRLPLNGAEFRQRALLALQQLRTEKRRSVSLAGVPTAEAFAA